MTSLSKLSTAVFHGFCKVVGSEKVVQTRRTVMDIEEMTTNSLTFTNPTLGDVSFHCSLNGSRRDGLCLPESDFDVMIWTDNVVVLPENMEQEQFSQFHNLEFHIQCVPSQPGFVRFKFLNATLDYIMMDSGMFIEFVYSQASMNDLKEFISIEENDVYIPNLAIGQFTQGLQTVWLQLHGPCVMFSIIETEIDIAISFKGNFWPPTATDWITRSSSSWPHPDIVQKIVQQGCHFVGKGSRESMHPYHEWRISFSKAENILVKSLNHCEFLTYGLLKVFFKEVVNNEDEPCFSSYFLKTVIFWKKQETALVWSPENFLTCFWECLKQIIQWVYQSYLPNFFIPENNMLKGKINELTRSRLLQRLSRLYNYGIGCIFLSESIRKSFNHQKFVNCSSNIETDENKEIRNELQFFSVVDNFPLFPYITTITNAFGVDTWRWFVCSYVSCKFQTKEKSVIANKLLTMYMHAQIFKNKDTNHVETNKAKLNKCKVFNNWLQISAFIGDLSMPLYKAMYLYMNGSYSSAVKILRKSKCILREPYVIYNRQVDGPVYLNTFSGKALRHKFRNAVAMDVLISCEVLQTYLDVDVSTMQNNGWAITRIPPLVFLHMLEILCFDKIDHDKRQRALHDLYFLVHFDKGKYVPIHLRDISWGLLGSCQYICGEYQGSQNSYAKALECRDINGIRGAMAERVQFALDGEAYRRS